MRAGALRNIVQILEYSTVSDGAGGTLFTYTNDATEILNSFANRVLAAGGTIENTTCSSDFVSEFIYVYNVWAEIVQKQGSRFQAGNKIELENYTQIVMRFEDIPNINKSWLLVFENRRFTIHSYFVVYEARKKVVINAVEIK